MQSNLSPKWAGLAAALVLVLAAPGVPAQTWNYEGSMNHDAEGPTVPGQMTLEASGGEYRLHMKQTHFSACYKSAMKAKVDRTPSAITITTTPVVPGCAPNRFVLNTDGTGGVREYENGGQWRRDETFRLRN